MYNFGTHRTHARFRASIHVKDAKVVIIIAMPYSTYCTNKNIHEAVIVVNSHLLILTLLYLCLIIRLRLAGMNIFIQVFIKLKFKEVEGICIMEKMRKLNELTE